MKLRFVSFFSLKTRKKNTDPIDFRLTLYLYFGFFSNVRIKKMIYVNRSITFKMPSYLVWREEFP
ncbi:hypothetical protein DLM78_11675 [Leptospira stimsonii]|uniref:Uncharacterized protein n=1 Tax=Leptospira stimsonii TaxID=2202203 RepID=A0A8B3CQL3_9LEPT|nr:hypothetical protein DLM78_11675 [Leptospira stimsonii]